MALDFGYGSDEERKPFFKFDARVGICKVRLEKDMEPQIRFPFDFAADICNTKQLHLCFPSEGPPLKLYFGEGVGPKNAPNPVGQHEFKIGFDVMLYVLSKHEATGGENIGILPWVACSYGAAKSFNRLHDLWQKPTPVTEEEFKKAEKNENLTPGKDRPDEVPIFSCSGAETVPVGKGYQSNLLQFTLKRWVPRKDIPGLAAALDSRTGSNVDDPTPHAVSGQDFPVEEFKFKRDLAVDSSPEENANDDLPF